MTRPGGGGALAVLDLMGKKIAEIPTDAHPESFQLEKTGTRVFINVPDHQEVEVADLVKGTVLGHWKVDVCTTNFPMSLDEAHHRLFVGCRIPARLAVFDTETGKIVASPAMVEHTDDLFFDASKDGFIFSAKASSMFGSRKTPITMNGFSAFLHPPTRPPACSYPI